MKNKILLSLLTLVLTALLTSCGNKSNNQPKFPPVPVTAYTVKTEVAFYYIDYPATVVALNQAEIRPEVSGYLTDIYFKDGQHVTRGMKLYGIDQQQYKAAYDVAKANLNKAQQDYETYKELAEKDAIAKQTLEHSFSDLEAAKSTLNDDMRLIGEEGIDLAVLPIGDNFTMGPEDSLRAVKLIEPKQVLPIHYNTFDIIQQDPAAWKALVEQQTSARVALLKPGESLEL